jgi:hypothetical protein
MTCFEINSPQTEMLHLCPKIFHNIYIDLGTYIFNFSLGMLAKLL